MLRILAEGGTQGGGLGTMVVMIAMMIVIFYFLIIRPQRKQEQQRRAMIDAVRKNDRIVTSGGIHGVVMNVKDDEVTVRIDEARDVKVRISKSAIAAVLTKEEDGEA